jgi:hypothetical protein
VLFAIRRLAPAAAVLGLWAWLGGFDAGREAHLLLPVAFALGLVALMSIRRYFWIRSTSRSRRNSEFIPH